MAEYGLMLSGKEAAAVDAALRMVTTKYDPDWIDLNALASVRGKLVHILDQHQIDTHDTPSARHTDGLGYTEMDAMPRPERRRPRG